jgi:hypothetical protein
MSISVRFMGSLLTRSVNDPRPELSHVLPGQPDAAAGQQHRRGRAAGAAGHRPGGFLTFGSGGGQLEPDTVVNGEARVVAAHDDRASDSSPSKPNPAHRGSYTLRAAVLSLRLPARLRDG